MGKRVGRPVKEAPQGGRVALSLRVTGPTKRKLEGAATKHGRSLSQEAELRIEQSFHRPSGLIVADGAMWSPIIFGDDSMEIYVGEEEIISLKITPEERSKLLAYFEGDE